MSRGSVGSSSRTSEGVRLLSNVRHQRFVARNCEDHQLLDWIGARALDDLRRHLHCPSSVAARGISFALYDDDDDDQEGLLTQQ